MRFFPVLFMIVCLASSAVAGEAKRSSHDHVLQSGVIRCAYTSVGFHIKKDLNTGFVQGPLADIAVAMGEVLNLSVEWTTEVGYADFADGLASGRYDAYCGILAIAPTRARAVAFTDPLFFTPYYLYVRQDEDRFADLHDMNHSRVRAGVIDGEVFQLITRKYFPDAREHSLPNMTPAAQLFVDLALGKADIIIHDPLIMMQYDRDNPGKIRRAYKDPLEVYPMGFAVAPHEHELRHMMNTAIMALHNLGKIDNILESYGIGDDVLYRVARFYRVPG